LYSKTFFYQKDLKEMNDQTTIDLLNREMDGEILPGEAETLRKRLSSDLATRELRDQLQATSSMLASVKEIEVPPGLKHGVMRAIDAKVEHEARRTEKKGHFSSVFGAIREAFSLKEAYIFSGGLAAGALVFALLSNVFSGSPLDNSSAVGTMAVRGESVTVSLDEVRGTISSEHSNGINSLSLRLLSPKEVSVRIAFDPGSLRFTGAKMLENPEVALSSRTGKIEITGNGSMSTKIDFASTAQPSSPVHISLFSSGQQIYEKSIVLDREGR
jgi:hypothetical protein